MKVAEFQIKKTVRANVCASGASVKIKFPRQLIQNIAIIFEKPDKTKVILKQAEVWLCADKFQIREIK